ncbi:hypothetical protein [Serratia fonticola]|uniref:hypothetical protein n=1 Tax=Serratia fonticola TaxID=47917 RepID=UPI00192D0AD7|nr:hypothetical protein [Serratia fonticola]MBL5829198.1 hypothetical protein [Serratia fonticola]
MVIEYRNRETFPRGVLHKTMRIINIAFSIFFSLSLGKDGVATAYEQNSSEPAIAAHIFNAKLT